MKELELEDVSHLTKEEKKEAVDMADSLMKKLDGKSAKEMQLEINELTK